MIRGSRFLFALLFSFLTHDLPGQNWQPNNFKPAHSPEGKYTLSHSEKPGKIAECGSEVLSLKGVGITDSIMVSSTSCHDCQQARFFWSKTAPLLVVETNEDKCEGPRYTKVFDMSKQALSFSRLGQLWLFDEKLDIAIISIGADELEDPPSTGKYVFSIYAYEVKRNRRTLIFSAENERPTYELTRGLSIEFEPNSTRTVALISNSAKIKIRY